MPMHRSTIDGKVSRTQKFANRWKKRSARITEDEVYEHFSDVFPVVDQTTIRTMAHEVKRGVLSLRTAYQYLMQKVQDMFSVVVKDLDFSRTHIKSVVSHFLQIFPILKKSVIHEVVKQVKCGTLKLRDAYNSLLDRMGHKLYHVGV